MAKSSFFSASGINATNTNVIQSSVISAANSAEQAALAFDKLDDRYLGNKTSNPTTDNDGDTLVVGTLYYNTVSNQILVYKDVGWENLTAAGSLQVSQNLADLASVETARSNLSLGNSTTDTYYIKSRASSGTAINVEGTIKASGSVDATSFARSGQTFLDPSGSLTNVSLDAGNF
jgi:hypothetical protein|tara:strand:- start:117 stop:644 length:528 start_codon:yes stop_codon:yes gene_type:complete